MVEVSDGQKWLRPTLCHKLSVKKSFLGAQLAIVLGASECHVQPIYMVKYMIITAQSKLVVLRSWNKLFLTVNDIGLKLNQ